MSYVLTKAFNLNTSKYSSYAMPFNDISSSNTYAPYIKAVYYSGIAQGYNNNFSPKDSVTREQFAAFIARAKSDKYRLPLPTTSTTEKVDTTQVIGLISVTTNGLNVRTAPNATASILGVVNTGGKLSVYAVEGSWLKVSYQGQYAYVNKSYVKFLEQDGNTIGSATKSVTANEDLNLYYKPSSSSKKITLISKGTKLSVYKEIAGYYLTMFNGLPGYIVKSSTTDVQVSTPTNTGSNSGTVTSTIAKVTIGGLNMRDSASTNGNVLKSLAKGTKLTVQSISGYWAKVSVGGVTGYVNKSYIKLINQSGSSVKNRIIILDPGHGGKDPGAIKESYTEKAIVLKVGKESIFIKKQEKDKVI